MTKSPKKKAPGAPPLYVDAIEAGRARLMLGDEAFTVPARLLPPGAREGSWVRLSGAVVPAPPSDAASRREKLARDDPGGPIKLGGASERDGHATRRG
jgi:hypothetical protein